MGMAGFYLLTDAFEQSLNLPSGEFEIGLAIQDRSINPDGTWSYPATVKQNFFGDTILVNGKVWPFLNVKQGKYRFRFLGGSNSRSYALSLSTGAPITIIGNDLGLLPAPINVTELTFGPGERYDGIIDFASYAPGTEIILQNSAPIKYPNSAAPTEGVLPEIMKFIITGDPGYTAPIPATLRPFRSIPESESVNTRILNLERDTEGCGGGEWLINGLHWDDITELPDLGTTEVWEWVNDTDIMHPMHLHLVAFQILDRFALDALGNPTGPPIPPEPYERGWKDTAMAHARTVTRVIAHFEDYIGKYAYHCHILEHEDHEMMRQFRTVSAACNNDGTCDPGEGCLGCPADCPAVSGAFCGNALCEAGNGEDCLSCPQDCAGKQNGSIANKYCCGDGAGTNPVDCSDTRCSTAGNHCRNSTRPDACCGDFMCEGAETAVSCGPSLPAPAPPTTCSAAWSPPYLRWAGCRAVRASRTTWRQPTFWTPPACRLWATPSTSWCAARISAPEGPAPTAMRGGIARNRQAGLPAVESEGQSPAPQCLQKAASRSWPSRRQAGQHWVVTGFDVSRASSVEKIPVGMMIRL
jgi:hypothetical protein